MLFDNILLGARKRFDKLPVFLGLESRLLPRMKVRGLIEAEGGLDRAQPKRGPSPHESAGPH